MAPRNEQSRFIRVRAFVSLIFKASRIIVRIYAQMRYGIQMLVLLQAMELWEQNLLLCLWINRTTFM